MALWLAIQCRLAAHRFESHFIHNRLINWECSGPSGEETGITAEFHSLHGFDFVRFNPCHGHLSYYAPFPSLLGYSDPSFQGGESEDLRAFQTEG